MRSQMVLWQGEKRKRAAEGIVSVFLSVLTVFAGTAYQQYAGVPEGSRKVIYLFLQILLWTVLYFAGFRITEGVLKKKEAAGREEYTLHFSAGRQMIGLMLCWLPYLLIYAPGLVNFDTINQINDFYDGISPVWFGFVEGQETVVALLNDHHPVFVTVLFSLIMLPWKAAGYPAGGIFCYCLLQMIFGAWVFVGFLSALKRWGLPRKAYQIIYGFLALMPFVALYMATMLKNTLHGIIFVWYLWKLLQMLHGEGGRKEMKWFWLTSVLLCLTQKTGIYLVVLTDLGLLFHKRMKKERKAVAGNAVCMLLLMMVLLPKVIYPILQIYPGGKQEMLGICFQQTSRLVCRGMEQMTPTEQEITDAVFDYNRIEELYDPHSSDPIKATYRLQAANEEITAYLKLWIRQGIRHPLSYIHSMLAISGAYFAPVEVVDAYDHIPEAEGVFADIRHVLPNGVLETVSALYRYLTGLPGIDLFFQTVLYTWWIPLIYVVGIIVRRKWELLFSAIPVGANILFLAVSPLYCTRYALPLIFAAPFLIGMLTVKESDTKTQNNVL